MNSDLLRIKEDIELLNKTRQLDILKIFLNEKISTTENKNGVFINLSYVNNETIKLLEEKLVYFKEQDKTIDEMEKIKQGFQENFFNEDNSINNIENKKQNKDKSIEYAT